MSRRRLRCSAVAAVGLILAGPCLADATGTSNDVVLDHARIDLTAVVARQYVAPLGTRITCPGNVCGWFVEKDGRPLVGAVVLRARSRDAQELVPLSGGGVGLARQTISGRTHLVVFGDIGTRITAKWLHVRWSKSSAKHVVTRADVLAPSDVLANTTLAAGTYDLALAAALNAHSPTAASVCLESLAIPCEANPRTDARASQLDLVDTATPFIFAAVTGTHFASTESVVADHATSSPASDFWMVAVPS